MIRRAFVFFLLSMSLYGQNAKVIHLSNEDSSEAKRLDENAKKAELDKKNFHNHIVAKYLLEAKGSFKEGWSSDFEYSTDYIYIVPSKYVNSYIVGSNNFYDR
jgi:hypothetical protein